MGCNPKFDAVLQKMAAIHDKKSEDYASAENRYSNFEFASKCAALFTDPLDQVFASLIGIKLARLGELRSSGKTPNHESIQDTRIDLTNYAALWASVYEQPAPFYPQLERVQFYNPQIAQHEALQSLRHKNLPDVHAVPYMGTSRALLDTRKAPVSTCE